MLILSQNGLLMVYNFALLLFFQTINYYYQIHTPAKNSFHNLSADLTEFSLVWHFHKDISIDLIVLSFLVCINNLIVSVTVIWQHKKFFQSHLTNFKHSFGTLLFKFFIQRQHIQKLCLKYLYKTLCSNFLTCIQS